MRSRHLCHRLCWPTSPFQTGGDALSRRRLPRSHDAFDDHEPDLEFLHADSPIEGTTLGHLTLAFTCGRASEGERGRQVKCVVSEQVLARAAWSLATGGDVGRLVDGRQDTDRHGVPSQYRSSSCSSFSRRFNSSSGSEVAQMSRICAPSREMTITARPRRMSDTNLSIASPSGRPYWLASISPCVCHS